MAKFKNTPAPSKDKKNTPIESLIFNAGDKALGGLYQHRMKILWGSLSFIVLLGAIVTVLAFSEQSDMRCSDKFFEPWSGVIKSMQEVESPLEVKLEDWATHIKGLENLIEANCSEKWTNLAHFYLGFLYFRTSNYDQSFEHYKKIIDKTDFPFVTHAIISIGKVAEHDKVFDSAITYFQKLIDQHPNSPFVNYAKYYQARCYEHLGEYDKALGIYKEISNDTYLKSPFDEVKKAIRRVKVIEVSKGLKEIKDVMVDATESGFTDSFINPTFGPGAGGQIQMPEIGTEGDQN